jgi:hypothetical protein
LGGRENPAAGPELAGPGRSTSTSATAPPNPVSDLRAAAAAAFQKPTATEGRMYCTTSRPELLALAVRSVGVITGVGIASATAAEPASDHR